MRAQGRAVLAMLIGALSLAADSPRALAAAQGGLWEVSMSATGHGSKAVCVAAPLELAQWEHRGARCTQVILSDEGNRTTVHYTCTAGGFGRSEVTLVTPRSLRVATQGISDNAPFNYVLYARRTGKCARR